MQLIDGLGGFEPHNGIRFSTSDVDRDTKGNGKCTDYFFGGWWFAHCGELILNGNVYDPSIPYYGIRWNKWNRKRNKNQSKMVIKFITNECE